MEKFNKLLKILFYPRDFIIDYSKWLNATSTIFVHVLIILLDSDLNRERFMRLKRYFFAW